MSEWGKNIRTKGCWRQLRIRKMCVCLRHQPRPPIHSPITPKTIAIFPVLFMTRGPSMFTGLVFAVTFVCVSRGPGLSTPYRGVTEIHTQKPYTPLNQKVSQNVLLAYADAAVPEGFSVQQNGFLLCFQWSAASAPFSPTRPSDGSTRKAV